MNVLVAVASKHGSSLEIGQVIESSLRSGGLNVDLRRLEDTPVLDGYDAAVLGSGVYSGHWMRAAREYVEANEFTWPRSWEDLRPTVVELYGPGAEDAMAQLQVRVKINWDLDLESFLATEPDGDRSGFETVTLESGRSPIQPTPTEFLYHRLKPSFLTRGN